MLTKTQLETFLRQVDKDFPVPISQKQDLAAYAEKLLAKATLCADCENGELRALVAGYTENLPEEKAYIALVATAAEARGKGLARALTAQFLQRCRQKKIPAVHLYTDPSNAPAIRMYHKLGFQAYLMDAEPRPGDVHLICYLDKEKEE